MNNFQIFPLLPLSILHCLVLFSWPIGSTMISLNMAQSLCSQATKFKETGKIQNAVKTKPSDSPFTSGLSSKSTRKRYCWFFWQKLEEEPGFVPIRCSPMYPGMTSAERKSSPRIAYGVEIVPDEFPSFGKLYFAIPLENKSDPDSWDRNLTNAFQQCSATLIAESWAITGEKQRLDIHL